MDLPKEQLKNGPVMNRSCTDIICCCLFLAFCVGMVGTACYGFIKGDPYLLLTTWDYDSKIILNKFIQGNGCGYNKTTLDYPYLYWPYPSINKSDPYQVF